MSKRCKQKERNCSDTGRKKRPRPGRQFIVPSTCSSTRPAEVRQSCVNRPNDPPTEDGESNYSMLRLPRVGLSPPLGGMCDGDLKNTSQEKIPLWFGTFVQKTHIALRLASSPLRRQNCASRPWTTPHTIKTTCCCPGPG